MGRPTKYGPERVAKVLEGVRLGLTYADAATYGGISTDTLARWRARYADFAEQLREAETRRRAVWLAGIQRAGQKDWRALAELLDRCGGPDYRKHTDVAVTHAGTVTHHHRDVTLFTDEELDRMAAMAERIKGERGTTP